MKILGGTPEEIEARAEMARRKYGAQTVNEILSRIIIFTLIGYMAIIFVVLAMFFSPIDDRVLTSVLLVLVGMEWLTEFALWAFTYQGMRKTEAPLADLQKFSTLTKEGWRRAEMVMDITSPVFKWIEDTWKRMGFGWKDEQNNQNQTTPPDQATPPSVTTEEAVSQLTDAVKELTVRVVQMQKKQNEMEKESLRHQ